MADEIPDDIQPYIFIGVGLISILYSFFKKNKVAELKLTGEKTEGIIFEGGLSPNRSVDSSSTSTTITVRFVTQKKEWITADTQINTGSYSKYYKPGDKLDIYYDPNDPYNFYVDEGTSTKSMRIYSALLGMALIVVGTYLLISNFHK